MIVAGLEIGATNSIHVSWIGVWSCTSVEIGTADMSAGLEEVLANLAPSISDSDWFIRIGSTGVCAGKSKYRDQYSCRYKIALHGLPL
jgi:hypothetical protein